MITAIIVFVLIIAMVAAGNNGEWGSVAVGAVIVLLLIAMCMSGLKTDRAYCYFVDYWANGEPSEREKRKAAKRCERYILEIVENGSCNTGRTEDATRRRKQGHAFVCHYCGRFIHERAERVLTGEGMMLMYSCPRCGRRNLTKIGA